MKQSHFFGHEMPKATWLYAVAPWLSLPETPRGKSGATGRMTRSRAQVAAGIRPGLCGEIPKKARARTPVAFAEWLIELASPSRPGA